MESYIMSHKNWKFDYSVLASVDVLNKKTEQVVKVFETSDLSDRTIRMIIKDIKKKQ